MTSKMPEVDFAKQFLSALDRVPAVRPADFVKDQKKYPARPPTLLPPLTIPYPTSKSSSVGTTGTPTSTRDAINAAGLSQETLDVTLTSTKPPKATHFISSQPLNTSILDLKAILASLLSPSSSSQQTPSIHPAQIRILFRRKPVTDSKILRDLILPVSSNSSSGAAGDDVTATAVQEMLKKGLELSFMISAKDDSTQASTLAAAAGISNKDVEMIDASPATAAVSASHQIADTPKFWHDLHGFLLQRLKDEVQARKMLEIFKDAMQTRKAL